MNKKLTMPCCYYPTTIVLLDDNALFVDMLQAELKENFPSKIFTSVKGAIQYLNAHQNQGAMIQHLLSANGDELEQDMDEVTTHFNLKKLSDYVANPQRHQEISVLVLDYAMPEMTGVSVARQLNFPFLKKLMLTGEADTSVAVGAFNERIIDQFISKDQGSDTEKLVKTIKELQMDYFRDITDSILNNASFEDYSSLGCLKEKAFADYFFNLLDQHDIVEYYLLDSSCNFILFDRNGGVSYLSVKSRIEMENYHEFVQITDNHSPVVAEMLNVKTHVPLFITDEDHTMTPSEWEPFMHPAEMIEGHDVFYVAYVRSAEQNSV